MEVQKSIKITRAAEKQHAPRLRQDPRTIGKSDERLCLVVPNEFHCRKKKVKCAKKAKHHQRKKPGVKGPLSGRDKVDVKKRNSPRGKGQGFWGEKYPPQLNWDQIRTLNGVSGRGM